MISWFARTIDLVEVFVLRLPDLVGGSSNIYLPPYYFETNDDQGKHEFHLVDGGVAANNPTLIAMGEISKQLIHKNEDFPLSLDYRRYLVISIGTGECKMDGGKYTTEEASKWGLLGWWFNANWSTPLVDILTQASTDMVDIHLSVVFKTLGVEKNYLRIQVFFSSDSSQLPTFFTFLHT
ncbi:putative Acyl transferase/acyl hydrolase/lysophospholipase [Helianthus anomalus]